MSSSTIRTTSNYYRFTLDGETNRRELVKVQDGVETVLASTEAGYQFNVELKLKVAVVDGEINVFLGDRNVFGDPVVDATNPLDARHGRRLFQRASAARSSTTSR